MIAILREGFLWRRRMIELSVLALLLSMTLIPSHHMIHDSSVEFEKRENLNPNSRELQPEFEENIRNNGTQILGYFTENLGQITRTDIRYYLQGYNISVGFADGVVLLNFRDNNVDEVSDLTLNSPVHPRRTATVEDFESNESDNVPDERAVLFQVRFESANNVRVVGNDEVQYKSNYFIGNDSSKWKNGVRNFRELMYKNLYDGIDLIYYIRGGLLKYDFIVHENSNPYSIRLAYEGIDTLNLDENGNLIIGTTVGKISDLAPFIYQEKNGKRHVIEGRYTLLYPNEVGFAISDYDANLPLIIDPGLRYSTFVAGSALEYGRDIVTDTNGNAYCTGHTKSADFPTTPGAYNISYSGGDDVFVFKLNSDGSTLLYSTFVGGGSSDWGYGISIDSGSNAYLTGSTMSSDFPITVGAYDSSFNGMADIFVLKLNSDGSILLYSTFVGGGNSEDGRAITVDKNGNAYATGETASSDFPSTVGSYDILYNGAWDGFIIKLSSDGSTLVYSSFIGGSGGDASLSIAIDAFDNIYNMGQTASSDFPVTVDAYDTSYNGNGDIFILKLDATGSSLTFSTYVGGSNSEYRGRLVMAANGDIYASGDTNSPDFPTTAGAYDTSYDAGLDVFVFGLNSAGSTLLFSTFLGGTDNDFGRGIAVDTSGNAYAVGDTSSLGFPTTAGAYDTSYNGNNDVFVAKLNPAGSALLYSSFVGGTDLEYSAGIAVDADSNAYVIGMTLSSDFPTTIGAYDTTYNGGYDTYALKLNMSSNTAPLATNLGVQTFINSPQILHIANHSPMLNWTYIDPDTDMMTQYDVKIGTTSGGSDMWASGAQLGSIPSGSSYSVIYGGLPVNDGTDYYFNVRVFDGLSWSGWTEKMFHINSIMAPVEPVIPIDAANIAASALQTISWTSGGIDPEGDAVTYNYEVSLNDNTFAPTNIIAQGNTGSTTSALFTTVSLSTYYWRVNANDTWENSTWGHSPANCWYFTTTTPNSPPVASFVGIQGRMANPGLGHITDHAPVLNWTYTDPENDALTAYDVKVGTVSGGGDKWAPGSQVGSTPSGTSFSVIYGGSALADGMTYYLSARVFDGTNWGGWTEIQFHMNAIISAATPIIPTDGTLISASSSQTVTWTSGGVDPEGDSIIYDYQVSLNDNTFAPSSIISQGITALFTSSTFATIPSSIYYWRVKTNDTWENSSWGNSPINYWYFVTIPPGNIAPIATSLAVQNHSTPPGRMHITDHTPDLNWTYTDSDMDPMTQYEVRVGIASGLNDKWASGVIVLPSASGVSVMTTYAGYSLADGTDYYFGVRVFDGADWSQWNETVFHMNAILAPMAPVVPADAAEIDASATQTVQWTSGGTDSEGDAITYYWEVSNVSTFSALVASGSASSLVSASFTTLSSSMYYWRVYANDTWESSTYGNAQTNHWTFTTRSIASGKSLIIEKNASPNPQVEGKKVNITACFSSSVGIEEVWVLVTGPDGNVLGNYSMTKVSGSCNYYYEMTYGQIGSHNYTIWAKSIAGQWAMDSGNFMIIRMPTLVAFNWKPVLALLFAAILLILGSIAVFRRPLMFNNEFRRKLYTWLVTVLPILIAEAGTGAISATTGLLCIPSAEGNIMSIGMAVDLAILLAGVFLYLMMLRRQKEVVLMSYMPIPPPMTMPPLDGNILLPPPYMEATISPVQNTYQYQQEQPRAILSRLNQASRICSVCGSLIESEFIFCPNCGKSI